VCVFCAAGVQVPVMAVISIARRLCHLFCYVPWTPWVVFMDSEHVVWIPTYFW